MKQIKFFLILSVFLLTGITYASAQVQTVSGIVKDSKGEPLPGASVFEKGTTNGTTTDADGKFTIKIAKYKELTVVFVGFDDATVAMNGATYYEIVMKESAEFLDEVVVIGMDNRQTRRSVTGAISTVSTKDLIQSPVANISNALAGKLPGLMTVQYSGEPGSDASTLYVRGLSTYGTSTPLVVIDGLPRTKADFDQLDANEIASITVLKDASSSSLYGIQGANGVLVVTTKRGTSNEKPQISFTLQQALQQPIRLPKTMSSYEQALYNRELDLNDGQPERYNDDVIEIIRSGSDPYLYPNTNWFDVVLKDHSWQSQYNINISGTAGKHIKYFVSGSYLNQGTLLNHQKEFEANYRMKQKYDRYNFRSNVDIQATDLLSIKIDLAARMESQVGPSSSFTNVFNQITSRLPSSQSVFNPNGTIAAASNLEMPYLNNPYGLITQSGYYEHNANVMYGTLSAVQDLKFITDGLSLKANFSFENNNYVHQTWSQSFDQYWYRGLNTAGEPIYQQYSVKSSLSLGGYNYIERSTYLDVRLNYDKTFGDHQINAQILGNRTLKNIQYQLPYAYQGISSRLAYSYAQKYFVEGNIGYNGSENFPPKRRYGFFPSLSVGWVLSEEPFLQMPDAVKILKLRGSYGIVGNDKIGGERWLYITEFTQGGTDLGYGGGYYFGKTSSGTSGAKGFNESRVGNEYVTWEKAKKLNVGFDASFFDNNVLNFTVDYFYERRDNILTAPGTINDYVGITNISPRNSGKVMNQGVEFEVTVNKQLNRDFAFFATLQGTYAKNKVLENDQPTPQYPYQDLRGYEIGYALGYKSDGFFKDWDDINNSATQSFGPVIPGDIKYVDTNKDGVIDPSDRVPIKVSSVPKMVTGFSFGFNYKQFDFSLMMNAAFGSSAKCWAYPSSIINLDRWSPDNLDAKMPVAHSTSNNTQVSDYNLMSTDYLKIRNMEIGYTFPKTLISRIKVSNARIYLNGQNLAVWDKMWLKDRDPESAGSGVLPYPLQRVFNLGLRFDI